MIDTESIYACAYAQYQTGKLSDAIELFRLLCFQNPYEGKFWFGLASSLQEDKSYEEALQAWAVTVVLAKDNPYPHFHAAECYFSQNNLEDGEKALEEAARIAGPEDPVRDKIALLREQWNIGKNL